MKSLVSKIKRYYLLILAGTLVLVNVLTFAPQVFATSLTKPEVILTNMQTSGASAIIIYFQVSAGNTGTTLTVTFPAGFTLASGSQTLSGSYNGTTCITMTGAAANLPGTPTATTAGQVITFGSLTGGFTGSTKYCEVITGSPITSNPSSASSPIIAIAAGTDASANTSVAIISTSNQITVTATVPVALSFSLSGTSLTFGTLAIGTVNVTTGAITATLSTNGTGWEIYGFDSNAGLTSASTSHTIASSTPGSAYTVSTINGEGYVLAINSTQTVLGAYANSGFSTPGLGSGLNGTVRTLVSGTTSVANATALFQEYAGISATTNPATDYTDTITLIGAGTF